MHDELEKWLAQLRRAHESGLLDGDTYRAAVAGLGQAGKETAKNPCCGAAGRNGLFGIYAGLPVQDTDRALGVYCRSMRDGCRRLPFRGMDFGGNTRSCGRKELALDHVYVELDTTTRMPGEMLLLSGGPPDMPTGGRAMKVLEAAACHPRLVVVGEPGSGKSSFLNHLIGRLALGCEDSGKVSPTGRMDWPEALVGLVPIHVVLPDFVRFLPDDATEPLPRHLWNFICSTLEARNLGFVAKPLHRVLEEGRAIVLFDGLDELAGLERRGFVRDAVEQFCNRYDRSRHLVTCRTLSYGDESWRLGGFPVVELAPLNGKKIDRFINAWFEEQARLGEIGKEEAASLAARLREEVRRPDLWPLAPNPLLLTVITLVHTHKGRLSDTRACLYEEITELLLWCGEEIRKGRRGEETPCLPLLLREAGRSVVDLKRFFRQVAFDAHSEGGAAEGDAPVDIGRLSLEKAFGMLHPEKCRNWSRDIVSAISCRTGLLLERAHGSFAFSHRIFQEYLAGAHLAVQPDFAVRAAGLAGKGAFWRDVIILAVGRLVYLGGDTGKPLALVDELCPAKTMDGELAWKNARLAGEVLLEIGLSRVRDGNQGCDLLERVKKRLAGLLGMGHLLPVDRSGAADILALLGDPRPGVGINKAGLPDIFWCDIEPGLFFMGSDNRLGKYDEEKPQFHCALIMESYRISRYPITNSQFLAFVVDGGYTEKWRRCWTAEGWRWKGQRIGPEKWGGVYDLANHPKVGVNWYEAVAFCNWLSARSGRRISLPSEAQWERAARHTDGRLYPWGEEDEPAIRCNMSETGIKSTSAVGIFPSGDARCGAADMAGNVWEWCSTKWLANYWNYENRVDDSLAGDEPRVLRGGSFNNYGSYVRCAFRYRYGFYPPFSDRNYGFRIVESAPLSGC